MNNYEEVLRQIRYRNWDTSATFDRKFRVKCSELNGRYTSNEFNLEVSNHLVKSAFPAQSLSSSLIFSNMEFSLKSVKL